MSNETYKTALALSGGGTHGSFQAGVLGYLYRIAKIQPDIITGTSVGSVNGMKLSEGTNINTIGTDLSSEGSTIGMPGLEKIWLNLRYTSDMYIPTPQMAALPIEISSQIEKSISGLASGVINSAVGGVVFDAGSILGGPLLSVISLGFLIDAANKAGDLLNKVDALISGQSLYLTDPVKTSYGKNIDLSQVLSSNIDLLFTACSLNTARLRYIRLNRSLSSDRALLGELFERYDLNTILYDINMREAMLASAAEPIFFNPIPIGNDLYIDGGVREILPTQPAVEMGAKKVFSIVCSTPTGSGSSSWNLLTIAGQTLGMLTSEITLQDQLFRGADGVLIFSVVPQVDVHSSLDIDPGLIRISRDYGYMCGFDCLDSRVRSADRRLLLRQTALMIATLRVACYNMENTIKTVNELNGTIPDLEMIKARIRELMESRLRLAGKDSLPPANDYYKTPGLQCWSNFEPFTSAATLSSQQHIYLWAGGIDSNKFVPYFSDAQLLAERNLWIERNGSGGWFFSSRNGPIGNFELLVPALDNNRIVINHYTRDNSNGFQWKIAGKVFAPGIGAKPLSICGFQSYDGSFQAVIRLNHTIELTTTGDTLLGVWHDTLSHQWRNYDVLVNGAVVDNIAGDPVMFQSTLGKNGDFELLVPQTDKDGNGVISHFRRGNDNVPVWVQAPSTPWPVPAINPALPPDVINIKTFATAVTAIQSSTGIPGNFVGIVSTTSILGAKSLVLITMDATTMVWSNQEIRASFMDSDTEGPVTGIVGDPTIFQTTFVQNDLHFLIPRILADGTLVISHFIWSNDARNIWIEGPYAWQQITGNGNPMYQTKIPARPVSIAVFQGNLGAGNYTFEGTWPGYSSWPGNAYLNLETNIEVLVRMTRPLGSDTLLALYYDPVNNTWSNAGSVTVSGNVLSLP